ncbi:carboxylating nicotinate-nucleotide diphosphorylase [Legionella erythra]|uniref:Probable nicotinate-nucleotide pyrophosphorylase [carboxylating] n=1 Tax=Legionella erythra TaxID=448 RepID=A0A0W0TFS2_LEGER|nr:carboxylating nicotinate-nucleotide diphosphorylase [Legionella erythra]KTC94463.1 nicotinate-nucleotide pyrophosphorylase [Legionella erythra]
MNVPFDEIKDNVKRALAEDIGSGDVSAALLPEELEATAEIFSREPMLICGQPWVNEVFAQVNPAIDIQWLVNEGEWLPEPTTLCQINGRARDLLTAERTALNFLQTLGATATQTWHYLQEIKGTKARLLDTRKTIPGLRLAQKYAVSCAGGINHRVGLYDAYLIKENHIKSCRSITQAILMAREKRPDLLIEVEVETLEELLEALNAGPDRILLDNFSHAMLAEAVILNQPYQCQLEASGGVTLDTIRSIALTGVDFISVGSITKSLQAIDLSLLIREIK